MFESMFFIYVLKVYILVGIKLIMYFNFLLKKLEKPKALYSM